MMSSTPRAEPLRLGSLILQPASDGAILQMDPASIFRDARPEDWHDRVQRTSSGNIELALTCLLVRAGDRHILVDTGFGQLPDRPEVGRLRSSLADLGVSTAAIDTVVISHPHADHIGGATLGQAAAAQLTYPSARYWLGQADWDHVTGPAKQRLGNVAEQVQVLSDSQHLDLASGEEELAPGVRLLPLPGHTPGHMGVSFTSGNEMAIYVGDLIHHELQIEHPEWSPVFDALPPLSRETRRRLVEQARRDHTLVLSYHLPFPGIGHIGPDGWQPV